MHHPWRAFRQLEDWRLRWDTLPAGTLGLTCHRTRTVTLALGLSQAERRCTIAHETQHVLRGPGSTCDDAHEQAAIERAVARLLIPSVRELADALARAHGCFESVADELWVDDMTLHARLGSLRVGERDYLRRRWADVVAGHPDLPALAPGRCHGVRSDRARGQEVGHAGGSTPNGIRTRATAVKGRGPGPLDDGGSTRVRDRTTIGVGRGRDQIRRGPTMVA